MDRISLITSMVINFIHLLCTWVVFALWVYVKYHLSFPMSSELSPDMPSYADNGFINSEDRDLSLAVLSYILQLYFFEAIVANVILGFARLKQYRKPFSTVQKYNKLAIFLTYLIIFVTLILMFYSIGNYFTPNYSWAIRHSIFNNLLEILIPSYLGLTIISTLILAIIWLNRYRNNQSNI